MVAVRRTGFTRRQSLVLLVTLVSLTVFCRYVGKTYFAAGNKVSVPMPTNWTFADAKKPIFFFDLGGTLCMCEKKWVVQDYWAKVFSGFAFNFAHVVGTFEFYVLLLDYKLILIAVFINEMIEELWLTSGYWGFTLDPPYDQEARYDSLVRDTICCMLGIHLAVRYGKLLRIKPLVKWPIRFGEEGKSNPHDFWRWAKFALQAGCMWQITLIFNADKGPFHFNVNNIFLILCYNAAVFIFYLWNVNDYPENSRRHVFCWYFGWGFVVSFVFGFAIYPVFKSAMYLILCVEALLSLILTGLEVLMNFYPSVFDELVFQPHKVPTNLGQNAASLPISLITECCSDLDILGKNYVSLKELGEILSQRLEQKLNSQKQRFSSNAFHSKTKVVTTLLSVALRLLILLVATSQPLLYSGVQYKRHWCGNPNVQGGNGCMD